MLQRLVMVAGQHRDAPVLTVLRRGMQLSSLCDLMSRPGNSSSEGDSRTRGRRHNVFEMPCATGQS